MHAAVHPEWQSPRSRASINLQRWWRCESGEPLQCGRIFRVDIIGEARMEADVGARMVKDEGEASTSSNEDGGTGRTRKRAAPSPRGSQRSQLTNIAVRHLQ